MSRLVFIHEWMRLWRTPRLVALLALAALLLAMTTWWSASTDARQIALQEQAAGEARAQWLGQGATNPHGMAHFGDFLFRPNGPLARIDKGVQAQMGQVLRVEGHSRAIPLATAASAAGPLARFGRFDPAFLLQNIVPLLLILVGAGLVIEGRSTRREWMLAHGVSARAFLWGQSGFLAAMGLCALVIVIATTVLASPVPLASEDLPRLAGMFGAYALFLIACSALIVVVSALSRSATAAILVLIGAWIIGTTVLPQATGTLVATIEPLPSRDVFEAAMRETRSAQIDAHNPADRRLAEMEAELMAKYGVSTREDLPVNFDGIAMQIDEEIGNAIWDEHFGALEAQMREQNRIASMVSLFNLFQAIRAVSMTFAGTDLVHDIAFQSEAEDYRRELVGALNHEHAYGGSTTGDWSFETDAAFFAGLAPFEYPATPISAVIGSRFVELAALLLWTLAAFAALVLAGRRLERGYAA